MSETNIDWRAKAEALQAAWDRIPWAALHAFAHRHDATPGDCVIQTVLSFADQIEGDRNDIAYRFACVLDHATGGVLSKPYYDTSTMYTYIDDYVNKQVEEAIEEDRKIRAPKMDISRF